MRERLRYLRSQHGAALLAAFKADPRNAAFFAESDAMSSDEAAALLFRRYRDADPTRTGACTQWLIRQALAGRMPAEDLGKAKETLEAFLVYKRRLPADRRDLGRYETLGAVWRAVEPFVLENAPVSGKDQDRRERVSARAESTILLEQAGWTVAIPRTERAAKWWGHGTRWCTASENDNRFHAYDRKGPLVVFVRPDGAKFQWHGPEQQFMDAADREADPRAALLDILTPMATPAAPTDSDAGALLLRSLLFALGSDGLPDESIFDDDASALMETAISVFGLPLQQIDERFWKPDIIRAAVKRSGENLPAIGHERQDRDMCFDAIRQDGLLLSAVAPHLLDYEMCLEAVGQNGSALRDVPLEMRDHGIYAAAANSPKAPFWLLKEIPREELTPEICEAVVSRSMLAFDDVPMEMRTRRVCLTAVRQSGTNLMMVPHHMRDREMCLEACKAPKGFPLRHVPEAVLDREMCINVVRRNRKALQHIPSHLLDEQTFLAAVQEDPMALPMIPHDRRSWAVCAAAIRRDQNMVHFVPSDLLSQMGGRSRAIELANRTPEIRMGEEPSRISVESGDLDSPPSPC